MRLCVTLGALLAGGSAALSPRARSAPGSAGHDRRAAGSRFVHSQRALRTKRKECAKSAVSGSAACQELGIDVENCVMRCAGGVTHFVGSKRWPLPPSSLSPSSVMWAGTHALR